MTPYEYSGGKYDTWMSEYVDPEIPEANGKKYGFMRRCLRT